MKREIHPYRYVLLLLISILVLSGGVVQAQAPNLLENPGFENPYVDRGGNPARMVAQGWTPWHVQATVGQASYQNQQPEYVQTAPNSLRVRNGNNAQHYFSYFATHQGGVFQRVTGITPGTEMRFDVYAYVWSSTFSDGEDSDRPGGVIVQVGIDPTGGTDGTSTNIVWSLPAEQYDAYRNYAISATAASNAVTVFVRSQVSVAVENNHIYLDDATLAVSTDQSNPIPTNTSQPAATNTVVVVPTNTSQPVATNTTQPTNTLVPATNTAIPTATTVDSGTGTDPTPTAEGFVPTNTAIPLNPTNTSEPVATNTSEPVVTNTAVPTTDAQEPTSESTAVVEPTSTGPITDEFPNTLVHVVQRGETVGQLATLYGSTIEAIRSANDLPANNLINIDQRLIIPVRLAAPATRTPTPIPQEGGQPGQSGGGDANVNTYTVSPGDTLYRVAVRYNTSVAALARLNGIVNVNLIQVGQVLRVPGVGDPAVPPVEVPQAPEQRTYVIQYGDNLFRIAFRFGVNAQRLAEVNGISNISLIYWGQTLIIP
ncbi:MAG: LysM peptidoglycan-binding domain-containing protein [Aggregatilineales bacterium]